MLRQNWLLAAVPEGLVLLGPETEIEVELHPEGAALERTAELIAAGANADAIAQAANLSVGDADDLIDQLVAAGALAPPEPFSDPRVALADAVIAALADESAGRHVWTADELLVLPAELRGPVLRRALRAFIAGFGSHLRLRAYAQLALTGRRTVFGDAPGGDEAATAVDRAGELDSGLVHVLDLRDGAVASAAPGALDGLGASAEHRLGTVVTCSSTAGAGETPIFMGGARYAQPNLRFPGPRHSSATGFGTDAAEAELIARAEAAERYACGDVAAHELRRGRAAELDGAVSPDALCRYSTRQYDERFPAERYDESEALLWVGGTTLDGGERWLPAELVFTPFADPERAGRLPPATSSGVAAHTDPAEPRWRALAELVERDAFMQTWVGRVSRERFDHAGLDSRTRALVAEVEGRGHTVEFVNLTLDTWPVVMCTVRDEGSLRISAACRPSAGAAAAKSLPEAAAAILWPLDDVPGPAAPEEVRTPEDHLRLYSRPDLLDEASFLFASAERIAFADVPPAEAPIEQLVEAIGESVFVDLSSPATAPFTVVRAAVPGIVPISFGYDREPLGMARLGLPREATRPILPHPFP